MSWHPKDYYYLLRDNTPRPIDTSSANRGLLVADEFTSDQAYLVITIC